VRRLVLLDSAVADFTAIFEYVTRESGSRVVGRRFVERLRDQCRTLASLPGTLGRARPELHADIRSISFRSYVIFFRYAGDRFEVINVLEDHRDISAHFGEDID